MFHIRYDRAKGPYGMMSEHLKLCLEEVREGKDPGDSRWQMFFKVVNLTFATGDLEAYFMWYTVVIILKGGRKLPGNWIN